MTKRDSESPEVGWEAEESEGDEPAGEFAGNNSAPTPRPGFHLQAARRIEEARERRQLRKAIEDFDDYDL
jgi:hypothetical protein